MYKSETLFKKTATGAIQTWRCWTEGDKLFTEFGQQGGQLQVSAPTVCKPKNVGRANETTAEQQADAEAVALWEKKLKSKGYTRSTDDAETGVADKLVAGGILPMLAHRFDEQGDKLKYPCFVQPKLDGHRCIGMCNNTLWSRTRKRITGVPHIEWALHDVEMPKEGDTCALDGELYNHYYHDKFEKLTHFIRQVTPTAGCEIVQYHVYDAVMPGTFRERFAYLEEVLGSGDHGPVKLVETREVFSEEELMLAFEDFLAQGYEGAIARNADGLYVNKRSYDLLKIKQFLDAEFEVTGVEEGTGKMQGHGIFVCKAANGSLFRAKMTGVHSELRKYFEHASDYVGKQLTVKYQGLSAYGIPRFPVALRIRED